MAEHDYVRLAAACHCGQPVKLWTGRGRKPRYCESHHAPPAAPKPTKECPACRGIFIPATPWHEYCSIGCRQGRSSWRPEEISCRSCSKLFLPTNSQAMYCSKGCKHRAWLEANPARATEQHQKHKATQKARRKPRPPSSPYVAGYCQECGTAWGARGQFKRCDDCKASIACKKERERHVRQHRSSARAVQCARCGCAFCPLYGMKPGGSAKWRCEPCAQQQRREWKRQQGGSHMHRAKQRGVPYRRFSLVQVLERDGWKCQLCGVPTPRRKRGTFVADAPEFDHCIPFALGGPHVPENGQCLCRACNSLKAAKWCSRSAAAALARGVQWQIAGATGDRA